MANLQVKSVPLFPAVVPTTDANGNYTQIIWRRGTENQSFGQFVDPSGNTWVTVAGVTLTGGQAPNGTTIPVNVDGEGNAYAAPPNTSVVGSTLAPPYYSKALEASAVIKNTAGVVFGISGYNSKGSAQFILLIDNGGPILAADGAIGIGFTVPATANFSIDFGYWGMPCYSGITVCNSSTNPTKTIGSADCTFLVRYV